jgi:exodeoxyribonuclease VII small subunit
MNKSASHPPAETPIENLNYEQAFEELVAVVNSLETSEHSLDQALELFKRGQALIQHCTNLLDTAELKVQQIIGAERSDFSIENDG